MAKQRGIRIAIDGPAGAGKSTVARLVANELGYIYVDTGAMYRAVTYAALQTGCDPEDGSAVAELAESLDLRLEPGVHGQTVRVDGVDVTQEIRSAEVSRHVSKVARIERVREVLVRLQKRMAERGGIVMDGRDIGSHVIPDAEVKIFLTADVEERARRRHREMLESGSDVTLERIIADLTARDEMDRNRAVSPLVVAEGAWILDTTKMTVDDVVREIVNRCRGVLAGVAGGEQE